MSDENFEVFISYGHQDQAWAHTLAEELHRAGLDVFLDEWEIGPGDVVVHQLEQGLRSFGSGVLVVSPASVERPWVQQEYAVMLGRAVKGRQRLIPVLLGDVELPPFAATRLWVDFRGAEGIEYERRVRELVAALRGERPPRPARDGERMLPPPETLERTHRPADFFVSYASADRAWAEWIAWQLEDEGYTVVVQAWDFAAGRDWVHEMQHATATAKRVVVVLSPSYQVPAYGEAEWRVFYGESPEGQRGLLLPVRIREMEPPGPLKTHVYVDLVNRDAASARAVLLTAARGYRGKPPAELEFPGGRQQPAATVAEAPRFPDEPATPGSAAAGGIFISYRREQTSGLAGRLYDRLADRFGEAQVFMDVDSIEPGIDFADAITHAVASCSVLLAVIGPGWLAASDEAGHRRLEDPDDLVRLEVEAALARDVRVIPVLVEGTVMPRRKDLPENLATLARRNAFILRHETFRPDASRLVELLERVLSGRAST